MARNASLPLSPEPDGLESLRREIREGFAQIERGEYEEYDEHTIQRLAADIKARGTKRLAERRKIKAL